MLVLGESQDYTSDVELGKVLRDAQHADIAIYIVGPSSTTADLRYGTAGLSGGNKLAPIKFAKHFPPISTQAPVDQMEHHGQGIQTLSGFSISIVCNFWGCNSPS